MPHPIAAFSVRHPEAPGVMITLDPAVDYDEGHELVKAYPSAFVPADTTQGIVESVAIEQATAGPGEKRNVRRPARS